MRRNHVRSLLLAVALTAMPFSAVQAQEARSSKPSSQSYTYKNLLTAPKPWPGERLGMMTANDKWSRFFRISWRLTGVRFNQQASILYDRKLRQLRYDDTSEDWAESGEKMLDARRTLIFHDVTPNHLEKLRLLSKQNTNGSIDGHIFQLLKLGVKANYLNSKRKVTLWELQS